jgi:glutaryl-CoA dehydrogenase
LVINIASPGLLDWADPCWLEDQLTEEERLIQATAREYAREKLAAFAN